MRKKALKTPLNKPCVLVTGGAGYIGAHTCKALAEAGFFPVTYDNLSTGDKRSVKWGPLEAGDISDSKKLSAVIKKYKPVAVLHFAALIAAGESVNHPELFYRNNVIGSYVLLETLRKAGIEYFVFSSSAAVYGTPEKNPITEQADTKPINPYGETKLAVEWMLEAYHKAHGLNYVALRYFNAAGADPDMEVGSYQKSPTNLIPVCMNVLLKKTRELKVFGNDYKTKDGTAIRDYIHVADLARAHVQALQYLIKKGGKSQSLNLGTGKGHTVMDVIHAAEKASGLKLPYKIVPRRPGDPPALIADNRKAFKVLGWKAQHTSLEYIVQTAYDWAKLHNG